MVASNSEQDGPRLREDALLVMRSAFLRAQKDFTRFTDPEIFYQEDERRWKDELVGLYHDRVLPLLGSGALDAEDAERVVAAVRAVLTARLASARGPQILLSWRYFDFLQRLAGRDAVALAGALQELLTGPGDSADRLGRFNAVFWPLLGRLGGYGPAVTRSFPTLLLMLNDPGADIYVRTDLFERAHKDLYGSPLFDEGPLTSEQYRRVLAMSWDIRRHLEAWGWQPRDMIDVQGFVWCALTAPPGGDERVPARTASGPPFGRILAQLADRGLYFPPEVVANYLLALQTKRFVLLTGISGTGKTRLAQAIAACFQPMVQVKVPDPVSEGWFELTVTPAMMRFHGLRLPDALAAAMELPTAGSRILGPIVVRYPEGSCTVTAYDHPRTGVVSVAIAGPLREWFIANLREGDSFAVRGVTQQPGGAMTGLEIALVPTTRRYVPFPNCEVVAVRPDWTDNVGLLGHYNPITERYLVTPFLQLVLRAGEEWAAARAEGRDPRPMFAILDEMNLARVEHYFSDFLSCMESGQPLHLHDSVGVETGETGDGLAVPRQIEIPPNLFFIGTVNVDETTYMFSPKVLDRAFTIELNEVDLEALGQDPRSGASTPSTPLVLQRMPESLLMLPRPGIDDWREFAERLGGQLAQRLGELNRILQPYNRHFGYRVAIEIARYVNLAARQAGEDEEVLAAALDLAILQKVLPKMHGTQQELQDLLEKLRDFAAGRSADGGFDADSTAPLTDADGGAGGEPADRAAQGVAPWMRLPRTEAKIARMLERLRRQGFTSFIE